MVFSPVCSGVILQSYDIFFVSDAPVPDFDAVALRYFALNVNGAPSSFLF
jgi:hypothetical protein